MNIDRNPIVILCAPTAGGKTDLVVRQDPEKFEVVSFDSRQVYKGMEIGSTQPTQEEVQRMPHHLVGILDPDQDINAKAYSEMASQAIQTVWSKAKIPILTAGTGFYLKAFLYGMFPAPDISEKIRSLVARMPLDEKLHSLGEIDPEALQSISKTDEYRLGRALEVNLSGQRWSEVLQQKNPGFLEEKKPEILVSAFLEWNRAELYSRINERAKRIVEEGKMVEEARRIISEYGKECPGIRTLGYNFALEIIEGSRNLESFYEKLSQVHRNYAKRQITWFRKETILQKMSWEDAYKEIKKI